MLGLGGGGQGDLVAEGLELFECAAFCLGGSGLLVVVGAEFSVGDVGPYPRILDTGCDYAAGRSVAV